MEDGDFGVGSIWRRIAASGLGGQDAGVAAVGRLAARMVEGAGAGKRWELRVDVGERRWDGAVWRVETLEVVGLRSGRKAIWGVAGIGGEAGSMTIPMVAADEACRVRLEFSRVSGFEDSELWKVDPIALPGVGVAHAVGLREGTVDGVGLRLHSLTAPGGRVPGGMREMWNRWSGDARAYTLWVEVGASGAERRLTLVRATDESGSAAEVQSGLWSGEQYAFGVVPASGARALGLVFALHRTRVVECVVDPRLGSTEVRGRWLAEDLGTN